MSAPASAIPAISVSAAASAPRTISLDLNGPVVEFAPTEHRNAQDLWWSIAEATYGITRPDPPGIGVQDMAAFIRDAVPLPQ